MTNMVILTSSITKGKKWTRTVKFPGFVRIERNGSFLVNLLFLNIFADSMVLARNVKIRLVGKR